MEWELKEYLRIVRKRLWLIVAMVAIAASAAAVVSYFVLTPVYSASTKIIVNKSSDSTGTTVQDLNTVTMNIRLVDTYKEIIKTTGIMDKVAAKFPEFGLTGEQMIGKVRVSSVNDTQVMTLSVEDPSHETAVRLVNAITEVFKEEIPQIMKVDNVTILSPAKPLDNPAPVRPNPKLNMMIAVVVSLMLAIGVAFLLEYLDDTIKSEKDVEQILAVPLLATIGRMRSDDNRDQTPLSSPSPRKVGEPHASVNR